MSTSKLEKVAAVGIAVGADVVDSIVGVAASFVSPITCFDRTECLQHPRASSTIVVVVVAAAAAAVVPAAAADADDNDNAAAAADDDDRGDDVDSRLSCRWL